VAPLTRSTDYPLDLLKGSGRITGYVTLASRIAGAVGRIAVDRLAEGLGKALPRTAQQLARPEVVGDLIRHGTPAGQIPLPRVLDVGLPGIEFESSNCSNFLIDVEFESSSDSESGAGRAQPLPKTLYAKLPCREISTRAFANAVGFWAVEATFCERVASQLPIRVPRVYAVAQRGARFVLLLENLQEDPGARLFINRDMAAGTTPDRSRMCLTTLAELHAAFWGLEAAEREALLPIRLHPFLAPGGRAMTRALNAAAIAPAHKAAPDLFEQRHVEICRLAIEKWDALIASWYSEPLTLIHGDSHLANCFEYTTPEGPRMGLIDFQGLQWCQGIRDVQYHLINSLEPDVLAEHEDELIDHYVAELGGHGIELTAEDAREQYRALSFQTLMVAVVSLGLGSLTERDATVRTVLRRSVAAIDRLGFGDWLARL
jgi:aminoglycoside/choline kinase family phosphotransferase